MNPSFSANNNPLSPPTANNNKQNSQDPIESKHNLKPTSSTLK